jgi:membrane protease YdiL (CAAX protease family)
MKFLERALDRKNQAWKYIVVCVCALLLWPAIGSIPLIVVGLLRFLSSGNSLELLASGDAMGLIQASLSKNMLLALLLFSTVVTFFLTVPLVRALHRRSFAEVVNGRKKVRFRRYLGGAGIWFAVMALTYASDFLINREDYALQFDLWRFIPLVFISLLLIPFQTAGEEFLFRGYLAQGLAAWTKSRWAALLLPSVLFGLMHAFNPEVAEFGFWATMPQYIWFGVFFGLLSLLDDGIELAAGVHAANNIFLSLFATHRSSALQTDAVLEVLHINPYKDTLLLVGMSLVAILYFAWKYGWNFRILTKPVSAPAGSGDLPGEGLKDY